MKIKQQHHRKPKIILMKKSISITFAALLFASVASFGQDQSRTKASESAAGDTKQTTGAGSSSGQEKKASESAPPRTPSTALKNNTASNGNGAPNGDGASGGSGASSRNKEVAKTGENSSRDNAKPILTSPEALAKRKKMMTQPDTVVKKGSGSGSRNTKNKTGKTGNYENEQFKSSHPRQPK
jgi:hypothetical protein